MQLLIRLPSPTLLAAEQQHHPTLPDPCFSLRWPTPAHLTSARHTSPSISLACSRLCVDDRPVDHLRYSAFQLGMRGTASQGCKLGFEDLTGWQGLPDVRGLSSMRLVEALQNSGLPRDQTDQQGYSATCGGSIHMHSLIYSRTIALPFSSQP